MVIQQRGKTISLVGAILQLLLAGVIVAIWLRTDSESAMASAFFLAAGVPLWLLAGLMFYCRQLAKREAREIEEITAAGATSTTIFAKDAEEDLHPAASRVKFMERWVAPIFTVVWAILQVIIGVLVLRFMAHKSSEPIVSPETGIIFMALVTFVGFLFSRYCLGMSERAEWRLLRSTGGYLFVNVLAMFAVGVAMAWSWWQGSGIVDYVVAYVVPIIQLTLAGEVTLNFLLDIYRPRVAGQEERFSFDSRLFNIVAQPGQVGHSLAEAINYQFGFEVSKSWFYQLLAKAMVPLLIFGALVVVGMTSLVVVDNGENCVVLHLGQPRVGADGTAASGILGPGVHFKWPWPIDSVRRFQTGKIHTIMLGVGKPRSAEQRQAAFVKGKELYLWGEEHGAMEETDFLIAAPPRNKDAATSRPGQQEPPPVNLIKMVVSVQYKVKDIFKYGFNFPNPEATLKALASREMTRYCASATLDEPVGKEQSNRPEGIMTFGQGKAAAELKRLIQEAADKELGLGVEITSVTFEAVHPPKEVALDYEQVLEAERRQEEAIYKAQADANQTLAQVAGDPTAALRLAMAIRQSQELETIRDGLGRPAFQKRLAESLTNIDDEITKLQGDIHQQALLGQADEKLTDLSRGTSSQQLLGEYRRYRQVIANLQSLASASKDGELKKVLDEQIAAASNEADQQLSEAKGRPAVIVANALAERWKMELSELARAQTFQSNLAAYRASPEVYMLDRWLDTWDAALPDVIKYVLAADRSKLNLWLDWTQSNRTMGESNYTGPRIEPGKK